MILDATFARHEQRKQLINRFGRLGVHLRFVETRADDEAVKERLEAREARADEISDARLEDYETLNSIYEVPAELPAQHCCATLTTQSDSLLKTLKWLARLEVASQCLL